MQVRFLHLQRRTVEQATPSGEFEPVERLEAGGSLYVTWDEAVDQAIDFGPFDLSALQAGQTVALPFDAPAGDSIEELTEAGFGKAGRLVRHREPVQGRLDLEAEPARPGLCKVGISVANTTEWAGTTESMASPARRDDALARSLLAVHMMLAVDGGTFVSLLDPPADAADAVARCRSDGAFPVLVGEDESVMLAAPIILYDHPEVAPESPGDLYDATEIDEILALRIMTLTDEEKAEARGTDDRAGAIIDRCDTMPPEVWERLHGAVRELRPAREQPGDVEGHVAPELKIPVLHTGPDGEVGGPWWDPGADPFADPATDRVVIGAVGVGRGDAVRLRPSRRADAQDLFVDGMTATVAGIFHDLDGNCHVAVTIDDDPASTELAWQGRYLYFHPEEIEPLDTFKGPR